MRLSERYFFTLRENVKDEDSASGNLLVRAGMIKKTSAGIYTILPLGLRVLRKIEEIVREEMNAIGSLEVLMPALLPEEVYINSGRRENFGDSMFALKDRFGRPFVLGPTHEELFAAAGSMHIKSYKDLPISLYQIQLKFRDEPRARFGLVRVREFTMKDSYTFDADLEGLDHSYQLMFGAYQRIFDRLGLRYVIVQADTGVMGGLLSEEFQALTDTGEDILVIGEDGKYAANIEIAECPMPKEVSDEKERTREKVHTPNAGTIAEVSAFLHRDPKEFLKTLVYMVDDQPYIFCLRGDHELNETKVRKFLSANEVRIASAEETYEATGVPVGFLGPIDAELPIVADYSASVMKNFVTGAGEKDYHFVDVNWSEVPEHQVADIRLIQEGDVTTGGTKVHFQRGIEVGNTFKLGNKYSQAMDLYYMDDKHNRIPVEMGSYGIGIERCMAAIVEQNNDGSHIFWPKHLAPIQVSVVIINTKKEEQMTLGEELYNELIKLPLDVVLDDRDERAGVKFNDMELIGVPYRITVGRDAKDGAVEIKTMDDEEKQTIKASEVLDAVKEYFGV